MIVVDLDERQSHGIVEVPFSFSTQMLRSVLAMKVSGVVDLATAPRFRMALTRVVAVASEAGSPCVLIDLTNVNFMDVQGLKAILAVARS